MKMLAASGITAIMSNLDDMLKAAEDYNGGGVDNYYQRLQDAVKLIQSETPPSTQPTTKPK